MKIFNRHAIRRLFEATSSSDKIGMATQVKEYLHKRLSLPDKDKDKLRPEQFSFKVIAESLGIDTTPGRELVLEDVTATQFSIIVGELISSKIMDAYNAAKRIGDMLVTPFPSSLEIDKIPGGWLNAMFENVGELQQYPQTADITDTWVQIGHQKRGIILNITAEAVQFDRTGIVLREAAKVGEEMARDREERILNAVVDNTGYKSFHYKATETDIYGNAGGTYHDYDNLVVDVMADYTDILALYLLLSLMKDERGKPCQVDPKILLVPKTLEITANRIIVNDVLPGGTNNERNPFANRFQILSSAILDAISTTAWFLGDFKKNFAEKVVIPPQVMTRRFGDNNEGAWTRDIVASYKARYDSKVGAVDYRYVGKSAGTG